LKGQKHQPYLENSDAAIHVLKGVAQDVAEGVSGAAEDGSTKVLIVARAILCSGGTHAQHTHSDPHAALGRHVKDRHVKGAAQSAAEDVRQDVAQDLAFGARAARALLTTPPPPPQPSLCSSRSR